MFKELKEKIDKLTNFLLKESDSVDNLNKEEYKIFKSNNNTLIEEENRHIVKRLLPEFSKELNRVLTFVGDDLDE